MSLDLGVNDREVKDKFLVLAWAVGWRHKLRLGSLGEKPLYFGELFRNFLPSAFVTMTLQEAKRWPVLVRHRKDFRFLAVGEVCWIWPIFESTSSPAWPLVHRACSITRFSTPLHTWHCVTGESISGPDPALKNLIGCVVHGEQDPPGSWLGHLISRQPRASC